MKVTHFMSSAVIIVSSWLIIPTLSAQAEDCDRIFRDAIEEASRETRTFHQAEVGFSFEIPANYRALEQSWGVQIYDPASYEWTQCIIRNQEAAEGILAPVTVNITYLPEEKPILTAVSEEHEWLLGNSFEVVDTPQGEVFVATGFDYLEEVEVGYVARISPNQQYLVLMSGPMNQRHLETATRTFQFDE